MAQRCGADMVMSGRETYTMRHMRWGVAVLGLCVLTGVTGCGGRQAEIKEDRLTVGRVLSLIHI